MQSGYITSQGLRLYYEIEGAGEPIILLNGGPGFPHYYLDDLRPLADAAQLIFLDQRGTGKSDKTDPSGYTIDAHVEDVEQLRRELGLERCGVFGHSWGGMLAQAYILKYPAHVTRLILADTFSSIADCNETLSRMRASVPQEVEAVYDKYEREGLYVGRDRYPDEYQAALDVAYEPVMLSVPPTPALQNMFANIAYDVYRAMWGEETDFKITGTLAQFDVEARLAEIRVPTLVIVGGSDMPTVAMAEKTARAIPNARLEVFEHSRHFPFLEEPDKFFRVMRAFLKSS